MAYQPIPVGVAQAIADMASAGYRQAEIAERLGVCRTTVRRYHPKRIAARRPPCLDVPADTRDLTGRFFGDPLPGRSALDQIQAERNG